MYFFKVYLICDNKRIGYGCVFVYVWVKVPLRLQGRASEHHNWSYRQLWATWLGDWEQNIVKTVCLLTTEQSLQPCFCLFNYTKHIGWKKYNEQTTGCLGMGNGLSFEYLCIMMVLQWGYKIYRLIETLLDKEQKTMDD